MKKFIFSIAVPVLFIMVTINSCGLTASVDEAIVFIEKFYGHLSDKNYDAAMEIIDDEVFETTSEEDMRTILTQKEQLGEFIGYEKDMSFNSSINNGVTTVELKYTCRYDQAKLHEKFVMVKRGDKYKILGYQYDEDKNAF